VRASVLLLILVVLVAGAVLATQLASRDDKAPAPPQPEAEPEAVEPEAVGEWAGSGLCAECHPDIHAKWSATNHALTIRDATPETVRKPFDGTVFRARGVDHQLGPGMTMECEGPGGETRRFDLHTVIGLRRVQMFTTKLPGGRIQVLPVFLQVPRSYWFDYTDFIFGTPEDFTVPDDSLFSWYGPHRNYNSRCGRCHSTNYEIGYDVETDAYDTTWSERIVACESCHGPAGAHVNKWRAREPGPDPIVNPVRLDVERANAVCGQCHAEAFMVRPGFRPGDSLWEHFDVAGLEDSTHLHPDGKARELIHALVPTMMSRCGPIRCTQCHDPHGRGIPGDLYRPLDDDWTCTQCHSEIAEDLEAHTHHPAASAGSRCVNCHMQPLVIEGGHGGVRDHTISIPSIENTREHGLPNACRTCHNTEFPGWEYEHFERWYPKADERNHRVPLAQALAAARARRAAPRVAELAKDENPVYRAAGAFWLAADPDASLASFLTDPHPLVQRAAVWGLARRDPELLEPMLRGENGVLRRAAALALVSEGALRDRPSLREKTLETLRVYLTWRPDDAALHLALARVLELMGRAEEAAEARARAQRLRWPG